MALNLGELSIALELENDKFRAGLANAKRDLESVPPAARREMVKVSRVMDEEGRKSGGTLAKGINQGLIRNSPLIVAGVGAALAAGAPVMTAAAGTLFAGVGAVAAAQTVEVRSAWTALGREIRDGAVADASVLVPVYVEMADKIGGAFRNMRPQLRDAFADSAPLIRSFTDGVIALGENAMPGLARSIAAAGPVFDGLESFLASTGQGLSDFFDAINGHGPAAGQVFASLGDVLGDLLPILGELMGQGAELAADVLPAVAVATGLTLDVLQALGPTLPAIVTGFAAFKAAKVAAGYLQTFAVQAQYATIAMTGSVTAGTRVGGALSSIGRSLPVVGIAVGVVAAAMATASAETDAWTQALLKGGAAAKQAQEEAAAASIDDFVVIGQWLGLVDTFEDVKQKADDYRASLSPLERAQLDLTKATNNLDAAITDHGANSSAAKKAKREYADASKEVERQEGRTELAIHGVTSAMIEQANQALAAASSDFAYRDSQQKLKDQILAVEGAMADENVSANDLAGVMLGLEKDTLAVAEAAGRLASDSLPASASELQKQQASAAGSLAELIRLKQEMGDRFPAALNQTIARLQQSGVALTATGVTADSVAQRMRDLGLSVTQVPGSKTVFINAPTEDQRARLKELGLIAQTLPNGRIVVTADTSPAAGTLAAFMNQRRVIQIQTAISTGRTYQGMGQQPTAATGGQIGDVVRRYSNGGKLSGPGTPTSDSIPALTYSGSPLLVSDEEWVIQARAARKYGDGVMAAINAGVAQVSVPGRGLAGGGQVGGAATSVLDRRDGALFHANTVNVIEGTPQDVAQELAYQARTRGW